MINAMILRLLTFLTWMGTFLVEHPTVFIFGSPECLVLLLTSALELVCLLNF